jgi:putative transposase
MSDLKYPQRRQPAHPVPVERPNQPIVLMVTVGLKKPNTYHCLDNQAFQKAVLHAWNRAPEWRPGYYMIMPDHIHFFCQPGTFERVVIGEWVRKWKAFVTTGLGHSGWRWLSGCWDTQMRGCDHYVEKRAYVEMNPARKGLVKSLEDWPYQGEISTITW